MLSTDTTAISTTNDNAVDLLANTAPDVINEFIVYNTSDNLGFVSIDNGHQWCPVPAGGGLTLDIRHAQTILGLKMKRVPSGGDVTMYAFGY